LFANRRQDADLAVPDLENCLVGIAIAVSDFDAMQSLDGDLIHFVGNRVVPVPRQAVDTGPDQEVRSDLLRHTEKFVDVAFAITDVDASTWIVQKLSRLLQILQPPDAFLPLDGNPRRVDLFLERGGRFECFPSPEFDGRQPERQPLGCYREARMHQDAAHRVRSQAARLIPSTVYVLRDADRLGTLSLVCEFGRVMQDQNETIRGSDAITGRLKMTGQNVRLADPVIGEKAIGSRGVGPVVCTKN
jgi:hypothetical protein